MKDRSLRRSESQLISGLERALRPAPRTRPAGLLWRWRHELLLAAGAGTAVAVLVHVLGTEWTVILASAAVGGLGPWPPWHQPFLAGLWRWITPHRLHAGFAQARIQSRKGKVPVVLRTTSEPFGERARVWCPAGTSAEDLASARAVLRAACWAADVRVIRDDRHAHLVTVEVIRRPALPGPGGQVTGGAAPRARPAARRTRLPVP
jgi:hypothetical protein